jgi:MYXO-CTERM domain-containing protein
VALLVCPAEASAIGSGVIMTHAAAYADHSWTMSSQNVKGWCTGSYSSDWEPGTHKGIAYDWGGFDTIAQYDQKLVDGYAAGSHSWHGVTECTTGVDCSGYVSRCWELTDKKGTATLGEVSHSVAKADMLPGDAWNKSGSHVVLWVGKADDGGPIFYEASGSASRVRLNSTASWSYLSGYSSIRYDNYEATPETPMTGGTLTDPILIQTFPFHHEANTKKSTSDLFDFYSCAPGTGEKGPEVIYKLSLTQAGKLTAKVTDGTGVDVDVHLLDGQTAQDCLIRNDKTFTTDVVAGTYWLVVDSYSDSAGIQYPGAYALDVGFESKGGPVAAPGTLSEPIPITSFPFHHEGNTSQSTSDAIDAYDCAKEKGEKGPEVVYSFTISAGGTIQVSVSDGEGVDIDVHLLWAPDSAACLARHDSAISLSIGPGSYWIVADTWSNSSGKTYPGAYMLDASFQPTVPCTPSCLGKQCGPNGCWGWCGQCGQWSVCQAGACVPSQLCGDGKCEPAAGEGCDACPADCPCGCGQTCVADICQLTACAGRQCGPDACGGYCGVCEDGYTCLRGECVENQMTDPKTEGCTEGEDACASLEEVATQQEVRSDSEQAVDGPSTFMLEGEMSAGKDKDDSGGCSAGASQSPFAAAILLLVLLAAWRRRCNVTTKRGRKPWVRQRL